MLIPVCLMPIYMTQSRFKGVVCTCVLRVESIVIVPCVPACLHRLPSSSSSPSVTALACARAALLLVSLS